MSELSMITTITRKNSGSFDGFLQKEHPERYEMKFEIMLTIPRENME